jgi:UDP-galactopyranose mutase
MSDSYDLLCFSHLRWDFVYQRPQHLISRFTKDHRVFFVEEPVFDSETPRLDVTPRPGGLQVLVAHLPWGPTEQEHGQMYRRLLDGFMKENAITNYVSWYYTPMMISWTSDLTPRAVVFDVMDELSAFAGAPPELLEREERLLQRADLVFAGGRSLYEGKRDRHPHVYFLASSVDIPHFAQARHGLPDPEDQKNIPHPRFGFFGVLDERFDWELLAQVADLRPAWQWIMVGPVSGKILDAALPHRPNIHYLGGKDYAELPAYLGGWDVATMPFARNESTRYISPTKTPEYLAAGKPVVSTSILDVVRLYGEAGMARIADTPEEFVAACEAALQEDASARIAHVDPFLSEMSWDKIWNKMYGLINEAVADTNPKTQNAGESI